jgi:hypothetical protein
MERSCWCLALQRQKKPGLWMPIALREDSYPLVRRTYLTLRAVSAPTATRQTGLVSLHSFCNSHHLPINTPASTTAEHLAIAPCSRAHVDLKTSSPFLVSMSLRLLPPVQCRMIEGPSCNDPALSGPLQSGDCGEFPLQLQPAVLLTKDNINHRNNS